MNKKKHIFIDKTIIVLSIRFYVSQQKTNFIVLEKLWMGGYLFKGQKEYVKSCFVYSHGCRVT